MQLSRPPPALAMIGFRKIAELKVYRERLGDTIGRFGIERGNNGFGFFDQHVPPPLAMFNEFLAQRFNPDSKSAGPACSTSTLPNEIPRERISRLRRKLFAAIFRIGG